MTKLLVCIDGSIHADYICKRAAWAAKRMNAEIDLLHVLSRHPNQESASSNQRRPTTSGAPDSPLKELPKAYENRDLHDQQKNKIILENGKRILHEAGISKVNFVHMTGRVAEAVRALEADSDIIFIGRCGENSNLNTDCLGSNLEIVARTIHKPLFVVSSDMRPINRFLIAYDGEDNARRAVDYIASQPLLKGLECHLLSVEQRSGDIDASHPIQKLNDAGFKVFSKIVQHERPAQMITTYVADKNIDLLIAGAYSHSRMHSLVLGSITTRMIQSCPVPILLFRE